MRPAIGLSLPRTVVPGARGRARLNNRWATRVVPLLALLLVLFPVPASADWLLTPFLGLKFGGSSGFLEDLDQASGKTTTTLGGSVTLMGRGIFGVEGDVGYMPNFFERDDVGLIGPGSSVTTLMGNMVVAAPLGITRDSLRPYFVGGVGLIYASVEDVVQTFPLRRRMPGITLGGGAVGMLSDSVGVRFDMRYLRSLGQGDEIPLREGPRLRFFRASVGVVYKL